MNLKSLLMFIALLTIPVSIYSFRWWLAEKTPACPDYCQTDFHSYRLNEETFLERVLPMVKDPRTFNLFVFVNPDKDCLACIFEAEYWLVPIEDYDHYMVHFFIPEEVPEERFRGFQEHYAIAPEQIIRFDRASPISPFNQFGVLKVFYEYGDGIHWFEPGTSDPEKQATFPDRIRRMIKGQSI